MASSNWVYDVFPSFSRKDNRRVSFLSRLLKELDRKLISVFKDNEIELTEVIRGSKIAVVVLSENYASSRWCLDELLEILKCKDELGQMVIPIFYGLDPYHVRNQTGEFGSIFEKTSKNEADDKIQLWRKALADVANIHGYHSWHWDNEEKLIGEIANDLKDKMNLGLSKDFDDSVGLEVHMKKINSLLQLESKEVRMIGIWGPAGIGKSTIARVLYSQYSHQFQSSVFIDRGFVSKSMENSTANPDDYNMKLHLQQRFLSKILRKKDIKVDHLGAIRERLKHQKVLIFIDDLEDRLVLDALAGQTQWFGSGSRIIVNTTNNHLLTSHGIDHNYEVCFPSEELALEMFCRSAFKQNKPPDGFRELASELALLAGSLPLGLNVLGSSLRGKNKEEWMDMLPRLRNGLDGNIEKTLRVSYDVLNNEEDKVIFLHIACLFNGEKVNDIKMQLADSELNVNIGLKNLVDKSLVHVREDTVKMHRLLQDMGKEIVRKQSSEPGKREFLFDAKDIISILQNNTGTEQVSGISFNLDDIDEFHIDKNAFKGMRNLRFLSIYAVKKVKQVRGHIPKGFNYFPPNLTVLRLDRYPMRYLPSNFIPESLVKLQIRGSRLEKLWKGIRPLKRLKIMDLRASRYLKEIPDLSMAISLEILRLNNCSSLVELPSSIKYLNKLKKLDMSFCTNLETLPTGINLQSLYRLDLRGCSRMRIFPDISTNISDFDLSQTAVEEIPSKLRLENLLDLSMEKMTSDQLWERVQPLTPVMNMMSSSLMGLSLSNIQSLVELPSSFHNLSKLKELSIIDCKHLETLPMGVNLESLDLLDLSGCSKLRSFPNISTHISELYLDRTAIEEVPWWIDIFTRLICLHMNGCHNLLCVSLNIYKLKHLETVDFSDCGALIEAIWNGSRNVVAMATDNVHSKLAVPAETSSPLPDYFVPKVKLNLINCFNLNQEALYQQQSVFFKSIELSGDEVPLYFTHRTTRTSLDIPLLQTSATQQFFRLRACTVVDSESFLKRYLSFNIHLCFRFTDRPGNHFDPAYRPLHFRKTTFGSHLVIFDCCFLINEDSAPLAGHNYYQMGIQFHLTSDYSQLKLKGCGVRLLEDSLPHGCEGNKGNEVNFGGHETKHSEESGESEECETGDILWDEKSDVNAKEAQSVQGGKMFYSKSRRGDHSIDNKTVDPAKDKNKHGKVSERSPMVTYDKHTSQHRVFINFWGEEVRFSFISHLVYALSTKGVNVVRENYEKRSDDLGKTLASIEDSNIALVVFSSRYTESRWCLDELVKIKERMDESKLLIIPIFYKVEVSEVKQLEGYFGLKLWNLWRIHRDHRMIKWKDALESVSAMTGFCLKDHSSESEFITLIVKEILSSISLLEGEKPSFVPSSGKREITKLSTGKGEKHESFLNKCPLFGLEQRMKQMEQKLEFDCNETRIIGVIGMPGIGKTTLAMMLHEKWNCKFVRCVPLLGIRKYPENYKPAWLRKTLLEVLLGGKFQILNEKTTHESVKEKLLQTKVFVVLDDVSNKTQLNFLLGDLSWIKKGSKIVITSCDNSLMEEFVHDTYVVPPLNYGEALQLFSYHAFGDHVFHPTVTFMKLCRDFVDCAGGNPLVIKLLSKQLHGRDEAQWEMRQEDLTHLGMVILNMFRFGCDELREKQKDVFLDIACFFRSEDDTFVRSILDSGDHDATDAESEVRDLIHKGKIYISGCRVEMHDLLYMFGKIYSSQALIEENGGKSRLWFTQEIIDALVNQKDTKSIRGILLDMSDVTNGIVLHTHTFINMLNLRYLKIYDSCCPRPCKAVCKLYFPGGLEFSLEKVRYLHWVKFPLAELPPDFRPENLVDLRLPYSMVKRVWQGVKDIPRLKRVDLSHSNKLVKLSGLAKAESLQRLNLEGCTNLDELPGEMENMKSLVYLNLRGCIRLISLPKMNLISLRTLVLSNCSNLKEFQVMSKSLQVLHLDGTAIKGLPPSIESLHSLVLFNMKDCKMLECLPNCLGQLEVLEELILSGCSRLKNIPAVRQSMRHVQILLLDETGAKEMPKISCFTELKGQASVDVLLQPSGSYISEWPRGFDGVSSLRHLSLSGNDFVSLQNDIGQLYNLTWLEVKQCKKLRSIPMLPPRLQYFDAHDCDSLEKVAHPLALPVMTVQAHAIFNFSNCNKLTQEAQDNIISYTRQRSQLMLGALSRYSEGFDLESSTRTCFPGGEVPEWFSHRGSGSVLEPRMPPHWCNSRYTGIALCAVILFPPYHEQRNRLLVNCNCELKNENGSSIHFSSTVGGWNQLRNTPSKMESSHVFIGYTSTLDINKHAGYDEEGCFCTKSSLEFQVTDGTEKVVGYEVLQCGFSLVYATDERENICWDAKTLVIPKRVKNVPGDEQSYRNSRKDDDIQYQSYSGPTQRRDEDLLSERKSSQNFVCIDRLNTRQKNVLLDIACFFRSEDEYFIRSLLDSGDPDCTDSVSEVRDLAEKLLITICDGRVEMNNRLYMFAKELGSAGRLRLWKYTDILDKLRKMKKMQEDDNVRGIFLDMSEVMQSIAMDSMTFINMRDLRYLKIYETCCPRKSKSDCKLEFPDGFDFPLEEVRYFHWLKFPLVELPSDFRPKNLVDLRLPYSNVERLWEGVKDTPMLKWVDLSHSSKLLNLSGLAKAPSLQRLNLEGCTNLDELPRDMQNMKSLVYLNMRGCIRLRSLPQMNLISLKILILSDCSNLKEFQVISQSLEVLHLDGTVIKELPLAIQKLERLVLLNLKNCKMLECLPNCLGKLKFLEELILSGCSRLENLPDVRHNMKHVQTLLFDGTGVDVMPDISCLIGYQGQASVDMSFQHFGSYCSPSEWPPGVNGISSLRRLCLSGHNFVSLHNEIGHLYNLTWLDVKQCKKLRSVPMLPARLQYFNAHGCDSLERVSNPLAIHTLTEQIHANFNFSNCNKLDQDASDAIITYTRWKSQLILDALSRYNGGFTLEASIGTCFPGWEVPAWFSHRASGSLLEPKLPPHWCDSRFTGIALCAVILFPGYEHQRNRLSVTCNCELKSEDGSRIRFSCAVGGWSDPCNAIESSHVFLGYASKLDIRKTFEDNEEGCMHTDASFEFQVTDGTKKLEGYEVMKCGFSLVYASDDLQVKSGEHGTNVGANQDITSSSWVQDFFGYIFLAFSCVIVSAILSFSVIVFTPKYYWSFSDFCWPLVARILFFMAFGLFLKQDDTRGNQSQDRNRGQ